MSILTGDMPYKPEMVCWPMAMIVWGVLFASTVQISACKERVTLPMIRMGTATEVMSPLVDAWNAMPVRPGFRYIKKAEPATSSSVFQLEYVTRSAWATQAQAATAMA